MVGIVVTISPSLSLYRMVVFPAASSPTIRILISFLPNNPLNRLPKFPILAHLRKDNGYRAVTSLKVWHHTANNDRELVSVLEADVDVCLLGTAGDVAADSTKCHLAWPIKPLKT